MNKPVTVTSIADLRQLLEASKLLGPRELAALDASAPSDARKGAGFLVTNGWLTKWQAGQLLGGFHRLVVGNYHLAQEIGRGYWGRVYLADHGKLRKRVALKVLSPQLSTQTVQVERFLAEARLAATLEHPNLIQVSDAGRDGERTFVVMEYVAGTDLRQYVQKRGPIDISRVIGWGLQVAEACEYLHRHGVVHGRLCPACLMVTDADTVKIQGVAAWSRPQVAPRETDVSGCYRAPEPSPPDARSDIYSLGRTMQFLLTGRPPRVAIRAPNDPAGTVADTALRTEAIPDVPRPLAVILDRMTAADPDQRYRNMAEVAAAFESLRSESPAGRCLPTAVNVW
jgi:serine/threonine-protein kinase